MPLSTQRRKKFNKISSADLQKLSKRPKLDDKPLNESSSFWRDLALSYFRDVDLNKDLDHLKEKIAKISKQEVLEEKPIGKAANEEGA